MRTLILGGARSGKSAHAESLVSSHSTLYVATARPWPGDADFADRIAHHVARRPFEWITEDSRDVVEVLLDPPPIDIIVDDLGTWLTHTIDATQAWEAPRGTCKERIDALVRAVDTFDGGNLVLVTPEVGMGVIPEHPSGRLFRDEIGKLNERLAQVCDKVVLVVAGLPLVLKPSQ